MERAGGILARLESTARGRWAGAANVWGLRLLHRWGPVRIARIIAAVVWAGILVETITLIRPDLLVPTVIGSDTSNYVASGERVLSGGDLYQLRPGDRPAPADNAPDWTVPILSPPPVGVIWAPLAALPAGLGFLLTWLAGLGSSAALGFWLIRRAPIAAVLVSMPYLSGLAVTAWSGNLNALIAPGAVLCWWLTRGDHPWRSFVAGGVIALLTATKLGPLLLLAWIVAERRWPAVHGFLATGFVFTLLTLITTGPDSVLEYLNVVRASAVAPSPVSIPGALAAAGVTPPWTSAALAVVVIGAAIAMWWARRYEAAVYGVAVVMMVLVTPVVRKETIAVVLAALAPFIIATHERPQWEWIGARKHLGVVAASLVVVGAWSVTSGALVRSTVTIVNETERPVTVRFSVPHQIATYGYEVEPRGVVTAWREVIGSPRGHALLFDESCTLLDAVELRPTGGGLIVRSSGMFAASELSSAPPGPYVASCTFEARTAVARYLYGVADYGE